MESPSGPEKQRPEPFWIRPPGLEMGLGLAIFSLVFAVYATAQYVCLLLRAWTLSPELHGQGSVWSVMSSDAFRQRLEDLALNGDVVAWLSLWAGVVGVIMVLGCTWLWKRARMKAFLGLGLPHWRPLLAWTGLFIVVFAVLQAVSWLIPMDDGVTRKILASVTDHPLFVLGVAVMPAIAEEFMVRGLLFGALRQLLDKHVTVALVSGFFTLIHMQYDWQLMLFYILPLSIVLGYARANTGSIWTGVLLHLLNNCLTILLPQTLSP